jgi:2-hydroxy-3-keto-5-methylthiopentenyl-1-phosphate phosphatase
VAEPVCAMAHHSIRSVVVDFDGTICASDVSDEVLIHFAGPVARRFDVQYERGEIGSRENLVRTGALVLAKEDEILAWALDRFVVEPSFPPFVEWCRSAGVEMTVVSDGIGIHIEPLLRAAGIEGLRVISNRLRLDGSAGRFEFDAGHPVCTGCGTCKMLEVTSARERGPLAYVGDGHSDRYGALYSDLVFAKGILIDLCLADGIDFVPWASFDDVRMFLEDGEPRRPINPDQCPGWRIA